jgi:hypothetical protein
MGLFATRKSHLLCEVLGWGTVRMADMSIPPDHFEKALAIAASASSLGEDGMKLILDNPLVDGLLHTVIPGLMPLGDFPENPDRVALDFALGWAVADAEESMGLAKRDLISKAATMALSQVRENPSIDGFAPAMWMFTDLGYTTNRLGLGPEEAMSRVLKATRTKNR